MKNIEIYTDGACRGNGKKDNIGAYGIVMLFNDQRKEIKKAFSNTTNNIMELLAVVDALKLLKSPCNVSLYSDSAYVVNAINNNWLDSWKSNGWVTSTKSPVKNKELWVSLDDLLKMHTVKFIKVKGHSSNILNNRCDELANTAMDEIK